MCSRVLLYPNSKVIKPNDLTAKEISITLSMVYAVNFFEGPDVFDVFGLEDGRREVFSRMICNYTP